MSLCLSLLLLFKKLPQYGNKSKLPIFNTRKNVLFPFYPPPPIGTWKELFSWQLIQRIMKRYVYLATKVESHTKHQRHVKASNMKHHIFPHWLLHIHFCIHNSIIGFNECWALFNLSEWADFKDTVICENASSTATLHSHSCCIPKLDILRETKAGYKRNLYWQMEGTSICSER